MAKKCKKLNICNTVMDKIHKRKITMHSRFYFIAGSILLGTSLFVAMVSSALFAHMAIFKMITDKPLKFLQFGKHGIVPFMRILPYFPILIALIGIIFSIALLRKYSISYKFNFIIISGGLVVAIFLAVAFLSQINFDNYARRFKPVHNMYSCKCGGKHWIQGQVLSIDDTHLATIVAYNKKTKLQWYDNTHFKCGDKISPDKNIIAIGSFKDDVFRAKVISMCKKAVSKPRNKTQKACQCKDMK